jgi:hypothetical protein
VGGLGSGLQRHGNRERKSRHVQLYQCKNIIVIYLSSSFVSGITVVSPIPITISRNKEALVNRRLLWRTPYECFEISLEVFLKLSTSVHFLPTVFVAHMFESWYLTISFFSRGSEPGEILKIQMVRFHLFISFLLRRLVVFQQ